MRLPARSVERVDLAILQVKLVIMTKLSEKFSNLKAKSFGIILALGLPLLLLYTSPAFAGVGVGVAPDFPANVTVGNNNVAVGLEITNNSTSDVGSVNLTSIKLIPSCGNNDADTTTCAGTEVDPGVFNVDAAGIGANACVGTSFTISETNATTGEVTFTPSGTVTLAQGATCRINFTVDVMQAPADDSSASAGLQTLQMGRVSATQSTDGLSGTGLGTDETTVAAQGHIVVDKVAIPSGSSQSFAFTTSGTGYNGFSLTDAATPNDQTLNAGSYSVAETAVTGWTLASSTCVSSIQDTETAGSLELDAGETITCTFNNTQDRGHIIIIKDSVPNDGQDFVFTNNFGNGNPGTFSLDDDSDNTLSNSRNSEVLAGSYTVSEGAVSGWSSNGGVCDMGETPSSLDVGAGETVTCTFTNTLQNGTLIVQKTTLPGATTTSFAINATGSGTITGGGVGSITDANDESYEVTAGTYSVTETLPLNWVQTSNTCTNVEVSAGETETCVITNTYTPPAIEWCSPGYWKNHPEEAAIAAAAGGFSLSDTYASQFGAAPALKNKALKDGASANPTLQQVLDHPQWYGGDAYNKVADLLSDSHPDLEFDEGDARVENCPLN